MEDKAVLRRIADEQVVLCKKYSEFRRKAGINKMNLELLLVTKINIIRDQKPNVGIDMAYLMLMDIEPEAKAYYRAWQSAEAEYKAIEKLIDANAGRISMEQSIMKREAEGERKGY
jgi:hypothetical protein